MCIINKGVLRLTHLSLQAVDQRSEPSTAPHQLSVVSYGKRAHTSVQATMEMRNGSCRVPVCASLARSLQELITTSEWVVPRLVMKVSSRHRDPRDHVSATTRLCGKGEVLAYPCPGSRPS